MPISVKVLYFGQAREAAGRGWEDISLPAPASVGTLVMKSTESHQMLQSMKGVMRVAVNEEIASENRQLSDGDVVAFLPPVAGG